SSFMKTSLTGVAAVLLAGSLQIGYAADVTGKITLKGTPKPEVDIDLGPSCGPVSTKKYTTRHYVVGKDGGLANVFVYLKKDGLKAAPQGPATMLDQKECMYQPYVFGVLTGQPFKIKNSDPLLHNVHATPKLNKEFNFGQPVKDQIMEKSFDTAEVMVRVKCDVHPWMFTYIGVLDHPYFAVSDADGNYKITGAPDGKYTLVAYHQKTHLAASLGETKEIEIKGGEVKQDFTVTVP
ncbi:MAG TPA: hypothetical protein VJS65_13960, partial [Verrucomicrobiae bacterium]|nr:hypothetical protein [Verrucomicrobiae bacterium]